MADNVQLNAGVGGVIAAADEVTAGVFHQRVKLSVGADGSASDAIPVSNGLDTTAAGVQAVGIVGQLDDVATGAVTENQFAPVRISTRRALLVEGVASGTAVKVDGSAVTQPVSAASLPLPSGAATSAKQDTLIAGLAGATKQELDYDTGAGTQTTPLVGIALPASGGPVAGGTSTNPLQVSLANTAANGTAVKVDGSAVTQPVSGTVTAVASGDHTVVGKAANGAAVSGNPVLIAGSDGTNARTIGATAAGFLQATLTSAIVGGMVAHAAHDAAVAGNPLMIGGYASAVAPTDVSTDGDAVRLWADKAGRLQIGDGGGSLTVDGTVATTNADLTTIAGAVKAEDVAHVSGDSGVMALAVRRDANTTLADATGDYAPLQVDATGSLKVAIISGAGSGGTSATDDAAFSVASGSGTPIMGLADETSPDSVDEGDVGIVRMTLPRALHVNLRDSSGNEVSVGGGTQYTEDAAAAANPVGTVPMLVRKDTPADEVSADGDNIAHRGTKYGAGYVTLLDTAGAPVAVGGGTQYTEDAAAAADPIGNALIMVRKDTLAALTSADGDNVAARGTDKGEMYVKHVDALTVNSHAVTNAGTFAVQATIAAGATNIAKAEDGASADGDVGVPALAVRKATPANTSGTDGDYEFLQMSAGRLWASATIDAAIPAGTNNIGDVDVLTVNGVAPAFNTGTRGATVQRVTIATDDVVPTSQSGTWTVQPGNTANTTPWLTDARGPVAHDGGVSGNPVLVAGNAQDTDDTAPPNRVSAESDVVRLATDRDGSLFVRTHGPQLWGYHVDGSSALTDASVHAAPGAGLSLYVTDIMISLGAATALNVFFEEGATKVLGPWYLEAVAGRSLKVHFSTPKKITANTALTVTSSAAVAHTIEVTGFTAQG